MNVQAQNEIKQAGIRDGAEWRDEVATKGQLIRLRRLSAERPNFEEWFEDTEQFGCGDTPAQVLAYIIDPKMARETGFGPDPTELFWNEIGGDEADTDDVDYLAGFVQGALCLSDSGKNLKTERPSASR